MGSLSYGSLIPPPSFFIDILIDLVHVQLLLADSLSVQLASEAEHDGAAGYTETTQKNHHQQESQLLQLCGFFICESLRQSDLECLSVRSFSPISCKEPNGLSVNDCVLFPLCVRTGCCKLLIKDQLRLALAHNAQFELFLQGVELALYLQLVLSICIQVNLPSTEEVSWNGRASSPHREDERVFIFERLISFCPIHSFFFSIYACSANTT